MCKMGIIVGLLHGAVVSTETKHVKLLAQCLDLHKWFKKQNKIKEEEQQPNYHDNPQQTERGLEPRAVQGTGSGFETIKYRRGFFISRKHNNCFAKCLTLGSF